MNRKRCSNSGPIRTRETDVSRCYKRGIAVGYKLGLQKPPPAELQAAVPARPRSISGLTLRTLGSLASEERIPYYSRMRKQELIAALLATGKFIP